MKQHSNQKPRPRGRSSNNQRKNGPPRNHNYDSNGPGVRIRGSAHQVMDKYLTLARDSAGQGDRVLSENYLQHAEHYFRIIQSQQPRTPRVANPAAAVAADGLEPQQGDTQSADAQPQAEEQNGEETVQDTPEKPPRRQTRGRRPRRVTPQADDKAKSDASAAEPVANSGEAIVEHTAVPAQEASAPEATKESTPA